MDTIIVNYAHLAATVSLVSELRHIRHGKFAVTLWVDAVYRIN
jgi:hypothetical protein